METIQVRGVTFKVHTTTRVNFAISTEIRDLLEEGFNVEFESGIWSNFSSLYTVEEILNNIEEYKEDWCLSEQDVEDLKIIKRLLNKVDSVLLEKAL